MIKANGLLFFKDCKHHVMINHVSHPGMHVFNFISERPVDRGMILKIVVKGGKDNICDVEFGLTLDNEDLAAGQKNIKLKDLVKSLNNLINETF